MTTEDVAQFVSNHMTASTPAGASADSLSSLADLLAHPDELAKFGQLLNSIKLSPDTIQALAKITPDQFVNVIKNAMSKPDIVQAAKTAWAAADQSPTVAMDTIAQPVQQSVQDSYEQAGIVFAAIGLSLAVPGVAVAVVALVVAGVAFVLGFADPVAFVVALVGLVVALIAFALAVPSLVAGIGGLVYALLPAAVRQRKVLSTNTISIQAPKGQYVSAQGGGGGQLYANQGAVGGFETFGVVDLGGGQIALQAANRQLVSAAGGGGGIVTVDRNAIGDWETFTPVSYGNNAFALKTANGHYIRADNQGGLGVTAFPNSATRGTSDIYAGSVFTISIVSGIPSTVLSPRLWVIGTDNKLYRWNGSGWDDPGNGGWGTRLAMSPSGQLYLLNAQRDNSIWRNDGNTWTQVPGAAFDIAFGPDGGMFVLGTDNHIYRWNGSGWDAAGSGGFGTRLVVSPTGQLFLLNANAGNTIWRNDGNTWTQVPGSALDIAFRRDGSLFIIGTDTRVYHWNGSGWDGFGCSGTRLAASSSGQLFALDATAGNRIMRNDVDTWNQMSGAALDVAIA
jgi:hypothetical protein